MYNQKSARFLIAPHPPPNISTTVTKIAISESAYYVRFL